MQQPVKSIQYKPDLNSVLITGKMTVDFASGHRHSNLKYKLRQYLKCVLNKTKNDYLYRV